MLDGVGDQVGDEALDQPRVAVGDGGCERSLHGQPARLDGFERLRGDRGEVDRFAIVEAALAAGEHEQRVDQAFLLLAGGEDLAEHRAQPLAAGVGVGERDLDQRALEVSGVRSSCETLAANWRCAAKDVSRRSSRRVEGVAELAQLVVGAVRARRRWRLLAEISRAAAVIVRSGRSARPATTQPSPIARSAMIASAMPDSIRSVSSAPWDAARRRPARPRRWQLECGGAARAADDRSAAPLEKPPTGALAPPPLAKAPPRSMTIWRPAVS